MCEALDLSHVGGLHPAGQYIDLLFLFGGRLGKVMDQRFRHVGKACDMRADIAWSIRVNDVLPLRNLALALCLADDLDHIVTDGLRKTSGVNGDHLRTVNVEHGLDCLEKVRLTAEHGCTFR